MVTIVGVKISVLLTWTLMYPKPLLSGLKNALNVAKSCPFPLTPRLFPSSNTKAALHKERIKCVKVLPLPIHTQVVPFVKHKGGPAQRMPWMWQSPDPSRSHPGCSPRQTQRRSFTKNALNAFVTRTLRYKDTSLQGPFVAWTLRYKALSLNYTFIPWPFVYKNISLQGRFVTVLRHFGGAS